MIADFEITNFRFFFVCASPMSFPAHRLSYHCSEVPAIRAVAASYLHSFISRARYVDGEDVRQVGRDFEEEESEEVACLTPKHKRYQYP